MRNKTITTFFAVTCLALATLALAGCANTLEGIKKDSARLEQKTQTVAEVITAP